MLDILSASPLKTRKSVEENGVKDEKEEEFKVMHDICIHAIVYIQFNVKATHNK